MAKARSPTPPPPSSPPAEPLSRRSAHAFGVRDRRRGDEYFLGRRVRLGPADQGGIGAEVSGSGREPYTVMVDWHETPESGDLGVFCNCPRFAGGYLCKHLWATLLAVDAAQYHRHVPGEGRLNVHPSYDLDLDGDDSFDPEDEEGWGEEGDEEPDPRDEIALDRADAHPSWRRQIEAIEHTLRIAERHDEAAPWAPGDEPPRRLELWLEIDLDATQMTGELTLDLFQRRERKNGAMGALKPLTLDRDTPRELTDPADRQLAELLRALPAGDSPRRLCYASDPDGTRHGPGIRMVRVPPALYDTVLPRLTASGRLGWWEGTREPPDPERRLAWDDGPPWRLTLRLETTGAGSEAELSGVLAREDEVVDLEEPVLLLAHGLVLFEDRIARLETAASFAWISCFRHQGSIEIPQEELSAAVEALGEMPSLPPVVLDDELPVAYRTPTPEPVLALEGDAGAGRLDASERGVRGTLAFRYGDHRVTAGDPRSVLIETGGAEAGEEAGGDAAAGVRVLRRDRAAEGEARRRLLDLGAVPERGGDLFFVPGARFLDLVDGLLREGWQVEARRARLRRAGGLHLSVASGVDWFDLTGSLRFDGEAVAVPRVLEAVRRGRDYVELGDGSRGMLPRDWLERFGALAGLGDPPESGDPSADAVRFQRSQALLVDSLLDTARAGTGSEVRVDEGFARLRDRLAHGHEVTPREEPAAFRGELRRYQKQGLGWLGFLAEVGLGGCLADDMGLGKTVQVLALLLARKAEEDGSREPRRPSLVVAPRSLVYNWLDEAARFAPELATLDYTGSGRKALRERFAEHDLVVTTYGTLRRDAAPLAEIHFGHAILDEAQAIKNPDSQTARAARSLRADHRLALTGTPVENHLAELGSLFEFLNPGMLGRSGRFQDLLDSRSTASPDAEPAAAELARALGPFILRRTKAEVLPELPPKTEQTLLVTLGRRQRALYDDLRDHYRARLGQRIREGGLAKSRMQVLEALLRLRQAACHPGLLEPERAGEGSAKLEALRDQLDEVLDEGHKALVFSQFTSLLTLARRDLDRDGIVYEYLDGKTRDRASRVERFQTDPDCRLFLISLKAGGTGLNLTAADYVFLLDPWWNPAVEAQALDRAHRIGQERPVIAYRLIAKDTVEEKILDLQATKRDLAEAVLSESGGALRKMSAEDLELLLS